MAMFLKNVDGDHEVVLTTVASPTGGIHSNAWRAGGTGVEKWLTLAQYAMHVWRPGRLQCFSSFFTLIYIVFNLGSKNEMTIS